MKNNERMCTEENYALRPLFAVYRLNGGATGRQSLAEPTHDSAEEVMEMRGDAEGRITNLVILFSTH
jgi:hypothetical protein